MGLSLLLLLAAFGCCAFSQGLFRVDSSKSKHEFLRAGLLARGWRELKKSRQVEPGFLWTFRWSGESPDRQLVNHFSGHTKLTSKWGLLASLTSHAHFFPRAHLCPRDQTRLAQDYHRTAASCAGQTLDETEQLLLGPLQPGIDCGGGQGKMWIAKPASGTRGVGIEVFSDLQKMEIFLAAQHEEEFVVQKYIEKPLLVFDRKVDVVLFFVFLSKLFSQSSI